VNVLFVAEDCPYPPDNGGRLRTFNLLKRLSLRHEITLIALAESEADINTAFGHSLKQVIQVSPVRRTPTRRLTTLVSRQPYIISKFASPEMSAAVGKTLADRSFDLLHCDSAMVAYCVPTNAPVPKVINMHNIEAMIWEHYVDKERRPWMMPLLRSQLSKIASYESHLPRLFDWCVTVSEQDRNQMRSRYGFENVSVVPNSVDLDFYEPLPEPPKPVVAFISSLDYRPNKDAVCWFMESIWPRVRAQMPEAQMMVVGRRPPRWMADRCRQADIALHSDVPDTRPYLADAAVIVVPIRIGGGTRLKILEAMAAGRCVVSTTIGAEGLCARDGEHLAIADEPVDFARKVVSLLRAPNTRQVLARQARALVEAEYGSDRAAGQMEEVWNQACAQQHINGETYASAQSSDHH